jgi:host factor-I protein
MDNDSALNVQNGYFNQIRKERTRVTFFLVNGQKITGTVKSFDKYTLLLDTRHGEQMIFKHAIATIAAFRPVEAPERAGTKPPEEKKFGNFIEFEGKKET